MPNISVVEVKDAIFDSLRDNEHKYGVTFLSEPYALDQVSHNVALNYDYVPYLSKLPSISQTGNVQEFNIAPHIVLDSTFVLSQGIRRRDINYANIHCIYNIGPGNTFMLAYCSISGVIYISEYLISNIDEKYKDDVISSISKIINHVKTICDSYIVTKTIDNTKKDIIITILSRIYNSINNPSNSYRDIPSNLKDNMFNILNEQLFKVFDTHSVSSFKMLGLSSKLYRRSLVNIYKVAQREKELSFRNGISIGSRILSAFMGAGYEFEIGTGKLVKNVKLVPDCCCFDSIYYKIKEDHQKWKIESLIFNPGQNMNTGSISLNCEGKHPNVSGGRICLGNENNNTFSKMVKAGVVNIEELTKVIIGVEDSLRIINFDSSYERVGSDFVRNHTNKMNTEVYINKNNKPVITKKARRITNASTTTSTTTSEPS